MPNETPKERARRKAGNRRRRVLRRHVREPFLRVVVWLFGWLPIGLAARTGELVGALAFRCARVTRSRVHAHLHQAFGDEKSAADLDAIARSNFRLMGRALCVLPGCARREPEFIRSRTEVVGAHFMEEAMRGGHGVLILTYHFGLFDAAGVWGALDWNGVAVGRDGADFGPTRLMITLREKMGVATIERGDARAIVRTLREARPVGMLADHDVEDVNGVFVPFFGKLAHTPIGPAALAIRTQAPIVPVVTEWTSRTTLRLRVLGVLRPRDDLPREEATGELTYRFTRLGEEAIRERPDHWIWIHQRWRTRPEQRPDLPVWEPPPGA